MKTVLPLAVVVLAVIAAHPLQAQEKIYTWTDARGNVHMTDEPPPQTAKVKDVVEAPVPTPGERLQVEEQRLRRTELRGEEKQRGELEELQRRAREAEEQAREAVRRADEQTERALEYRKRFGNTPSRREQFKYRIRAEEERAEAARTEAQRAIDRAKASAEEARAAAGQAQAAKPGAK